MMHEAPADGIVIEIEQSLLGGLMAGPGIMSVRGFLREDHFLDDTHRHIFRAICDAQERFGATQLHLVASLLPATLKGAFRLKTGMEVSRYLARLLSETAHGGSLIMVGAHAVVEQWARLRLREELTLAVEAASQPEASPIALLRSVGSMMEDVRASLSRRGGQSARGTIAEAGRHALQAAKEARETKGGLTGITWGLTDVDRQTGGMQRKDLILVGARPSMGKTSLMTSCALKAARKGSGVGILSLEMDARKLTARALSDLSHSTHSQIPYVDLLRGAIDDEQVTHLESLNSQLERLPIEIDEASVTTFDVRAKIEGMLERFERLKWPRLDVLMIDHLGFVQPGASYRGNRNNEIGEITRALKDYAKEYDIALVLLSQLSRDLTKRDDKRPQLNDLRDSGNIEQDADVVVFLHREAYYLERSGPVTDVDDDRLEQLSNLKNKLEFIIAKQRNGPVGTTDLWCDMAFSAVRNAGRYGQ